MIEYIEGLGAELQFLVPDDGKVLHQCQIRSKSAWLCARGAGRAVLSWTRLREAGCVVDLEARPMEASHRVADDVGIDGMQRAGISVIVGCNREGLTCSELLNPRKLPATHKLPVRDVIGVEEFFSRSKGKDIDSA